MIVYPDVAKETFEQNHTTVSHAGGQAKPPNVDVVFIENQYDPDPNDNHFESTILYLIREDGRFRLESDYHKLGLFTLEMWRASLSESGFRVFEEKYDGPDATNLPVFVCR
ncbi:MAG: hypothetical protein HY537_17310 [Deltaproteobacteria bacterium]|nr:hypothetical protein [Deltaproteobacteria bacterium]